MILLWVGWITLMYDDKLVVDTLYENIFMYNTIWLQQQLKDQQNPLIYKLFWVKANFIRDKERKALSAIIFSSDGRKNIANKGQ